MATAAVSSKPNPLASSHPVLVPYAQELFYDNAAFASYLSELPLNPRPKKEINEPDRMDSESEEDQESEDDEEEASVSESGDKVCPITGMTVDDPKPSVPTFASILAAGIPPPAPPAPPAPSAPAFITTENNDITNASANDPHVDLFNDTSRGTHHSTLDKLLTEAWTKDPLLTLKCIWNARSIHAGKSERTLFYQCMGWLRDNHPRTFLANLEWIVRPIIEKKMKKEDEEGTEVGGEGDVVEMNEIKDENDETRFDVKNGVSHGFYRDLGNLLVLAVKDELCTTGNPKEGLQTPAQAKKPKEYKPSMRGRSVRGRGRGRGRSSRVPPYTVGVGRYDGGTLVIGRRPEPTEEEESEQPAKKKPKSTDPEAWAALKAANAEAGKKAKEEAKERRHQEEAEALLNLTTRFNAEDPFYKALHLSVARIFAAQLKRDVELLESSKKKNINKISLAAKWAPSLEKTIDRSTLLASSIAEILFTPSDFPEIDANDRELYLKHARQRYRILISKLRAALEVVERKLSAKDYKTIAYDKIPSMAMKRHTKKFYAEDPEGFMVYLTDVATGKAKISGAVLLPGNMVHTVKKGDNEIEKLVADQQWNALVQRIRDSGTLESSISVCDVSGSMETQVGDNTTAMDNAIGLSLLLAAVAEEPWKDTLVTFSESPTFIKVDTTKTFTEQVRQVSDAPWGMNTDFVAVFEKLILPMAVAHKVPQENMVKKVFVFSDMEFDGCGGSMYQSSFDRIKEQYEKAGYEMPECIFWNLAAGAYSYYGNHVKKKPVTKDDVGTCLVSGYSQALLKVFMDKGGFEDLEDEDDEDEEEDQEEEIVEIEMGEGDQDPIVKEKDGKKKKKISPLGIVKKAVNGPMYDMLKVVN